MCLNKIVSTPSPKRRDFDQLLDFTSILSKTFVSPKGIATARSRTDSAEATFVFRFFHLYKTLMDAKYSFSVKKTDHIIIIGCGDFQGPDIDKSHLFSPQLFELAALCCEGKITVVDSDKGVMDKAISGQF